MAVPVVLADDYVDVDELVAKYHRRKSTLIFLISAIALIFFGTLSGYTALQHSSAKLDSAKATVVEFANATLDSEKCMATPEDPLCEKARRVIADPEAAVKGGSFETGPQTPIQIAVGDFGSDPIAGFVAALLTQPIILRIQ